MARRNPKTPGTVKEVLSRNVRAQQKRVKWAASPPEAQRPVRERIRSRQPKQ